MLLKVLGGIHVEISTNISDASRLQVRKSNLLSSMDAEGQSIRQAHQAAGIDCLVDSTPTLLPIRHLPLYDI